MKVPLALGKVTVSGKKFATRDKESESLVYCGAFARFAMQLTLARRKTLRFTCHH